MKNIVKEEARRYIGEHPVLFYNFYRLRPRHRDLLVDPTTQLVIEGFPRSGNTFAVVAFQQAQSENVRIAHHLHMPAQVMRAARWSIPTLVLIRKPTDAVLSWAVRDPRISVRQALKHYLSFYGKIDGNRQAFVVGAFEEVIRDYGAVLERINARFDTHFSSFEHSEDNTAKVFNRIEEMHRARRSSRLDEKQISRPSVLKTGMKDASRRELEARGTRDLLVRAGEIYEGFVSGRW